VTFFEGEAGAEGYCIATKREQARRVFDDAKKMVKSSGLSSRIKVNASNLYREATSRSSSRWDRMRIRPTA
jgi:phage terminase large subunit-like protein